MATITINPSVTNATASSSLKRFSINISGGTIDDFSVAFENPEENADLAYIKTGGNMFNVLVPDNYYEKQRVIKGSAFVRTGISTALASFTINQTAASYVLDKTQYDFDGTYGSALILEIKTNVDISKNLSFSIPENWIKYNSAVYDAINGIQTIRFDVNANTTSNFRNMEFTIYVTVDGVFIKTFNINVVQSTRSTILPIYIDSSFAADGDAAEYSITLDNEEIFKGKAYRRPGDTYTRIYARDIIAEYLGHKWPNTGFQKMDEYMKTFIVSGKDFVYTTKWYNNWSYKAFNTESPSFLSDPINNVVHKNQIFIVSVFFPTYGKLVFKVNNQLISEHIGGNGGYTFSVNLRDYNCGDVITVEIWDEQSKYATKNYIIDDSDKEYVVYYVNAAGGWDSLLIGGNAIKTNEITSETYRTRNADAYYFDKTKYLNTITSKWRLYTGYLSNTEADKINNLFESTFVYLRNIKTGKFTPVLITNNSFDYKTYTNQGKKKFYYTIELEESKLKYRK